LCNVQQVLCILAKHISVVTRTTSMFPFVTKGVITPLVTKKKIEVEKTSTDFGRFYVYAPLACLKVLPRYWASIAKGLQCKISVGVKDLTLTILWKNLEMEKELIFPESIMNLHNSTHFCFSIFG